MRQEFEVNDKVKKFQNDHFTADMLQTLYTHCTPSGQPENFQYFLFEHLIETSCILEKWGSEEYLWRAGAFHSIYSTEAFTSLAVPFSPFPLERREEIRLLIGSKSEHLAYLFCAMVRKAFFDNLEKESEFTVFDRFNKVEIYISKNEYIDLLILTLADWIEPVIGKENDPHPKTVEHVKASHKEAFIKASRFFPEEAVKDFYLAYEMK